MTAQIDFLSAANDANRPTRPVSDIDGLQEEIASLDQHLVVAMTRRSELAARIANSGATFEVSIDRFDDLGTSAPAFTRALNRLVGRRGTAIS